MIDTSKSTGLLSLVDNRGGGGGGGEGFKLLLFCLITSVIYYPDVNVHVSGVGDF